jgi:epoxyqueuosine reductase
VSFAPTGAEVRRLIDETAASLGFDLVGVAAAEPLHAELRRYQDWLSASRQGEMGWMTEERARRSARPESVLPGARSVICVALQYWTGRRSAPRPGQGKVARYAWGVDYHEILGQRLKALAAELERAFGGRHRWYVDTGPLMDKALAARAGLGWYGKNTNLLTPRYGSFVLLGEIVTTLEVEPDAPLERDCGKCDLCTRACPTGALGPDYSIDSRRCISYLTIEYRGSIPPDLRPLMRDWVFGCDICQDVCPPSVQPRLGDAIERREWALEVRAAVAGGTPASSPASRPAPQSGPLFPDGPRQSLDLVWLLFLTHQEYVEAFRGTSIKRAKCWMLRRNAAVALGNSGSADHLPALLRAAASDEEPLVRGHAAWAAGRLAARHGVDASAPLTALLQHERDQEVVQEIQQALARGRDAASGAPQAPPVVPSLTRTQRADPDLSTSHGGNRTPD